MSLHCNGRLAGARGSCARKKREEGRGRRREEEESGTMLGFKRSVSHKEDDVTLIATILEDDEDPADSRGDWDVQVSANRSSCRPRVVFVLC